MTVVNLKQAPVQEEEVEGDAESGLLAMETVFLQAWTVADPYRK